MGGSGSKQPQKCMKGCDTAYVQERKIIEPVAAAVAKTGNALLGPEFEDKDAYAGCVKGCDTAFVQGKPHNISDRQQAVDALGEGTIEALEIVPGLDMARCVQAAVNRIQKDPMSREHAARCYTDIAMDAAVVATGGEAEGAKSCRSR